MTLNPAPNETGLSPKYGTELTRFGKWIATSKGILIIQQTIEPVDFFIPNETIQQLSSMRGLLETLLKEHSLDAIDYQQLITAWFYKLSLTRINPDPDEPDLSETLAEIQRMLEKKFSASLS